MNRKEWSYHGNTGPSYWHEEFKSCDSKKQSPINLETKLAIKEKIDPLVFHNYDVTPDFMKVVNDGRLVALDLKMPNMPYIEGGGLKGSYEFVRMDIHWGRTPYIGSEHYIDSASFPFELQLVHYKKEYGSVQEAKKRADGLAVLGVFVTFGEQENPILSSVSASLKDIVTPKSDTRIRAVPLRGFLPQNTTTFFRYEGSLTSPPCFDAIWSIFPNTISTTQQSMLGFNSPTDDAGFPLSGNYRPLQLRTDWAYLVHSGGEV